MVHPNSTTGGTFVLAVDNGYNARGELKTQTDINQQVTRMFYDGRGNQVRRESPTVAGQMGVALMEYDFAGRLRRETRAQGTSAQSIWEYDYDENGNRTLVRDPRGFDYGFFYDDANRLRELHYPMVAGSSFIESWTYDDRGNLQTHTDLEGKVATFTYDLQNRALTETHVKNAQTAAAIQKGYDHQGNLVFVWDQATMNLVAYTNQANLPAYDALNRLTEVRWVKEATSVSLNPTTKVLTFNGSLIGRVAYGYDKTSRVTGAVVSAVAGGGFEDHAYAYTYDANGRLDEVRRGGPGQTPVLVADHVWTVAGGKKEVQFSNGHAQVSDYDLEGRVQHLRLRQPDQSFSSHLEYEYDERDRRRAIVFHTLQRRVDYGYDDQDRLTSETWTSTAPGQTPPPCQNNIQDLAIGNVSVFAGPACVTPTSGALLYQASWTYDASGNRMTQTVNQGPVTSYAYDAQNRLTSAGPVGYTYTRNGNQETRTEGGVTENFTYDYMNRVKTYLKGSASFMYVYMPTGERVTKLNVPAGTEETFFYDGQDVVVDYTRTSGGPLTLARTYVNTPSSIDSKLARIEAGGALHFYVGDALGSVHEMMDQAGATVRRELYTAWGEKLPGFAGIDFPDRYAFTHRERDDESSLMHYRARSYDPRLARFIQRDTVNENVVMEHYVYAGLRPTALIDPTGRRHSLPASSNCAGKWATARLVIHEELKADVYWSHVAAELRDLWPGAPIGQVGPFDQTLFVHGFVDPFPPKAKVSGTTVYAGFWRAQRTLALAELSGACAFHISIFSGWAGGELGETQPWREFKVTIDEEEIAKWVQDPKNVPDRKGHTVRELIAHLTTAAVLHEIGHALGADHYRTSDVGDVMARRPNAYWATAHTYFMSRADREVREHLTHKAGDHRILEVVEAP